MSSLIWLLAAAAIYPKNATLAQKQAWLQVFFSPQPNQLIEVSNRAIAIENRDPLLVKGEIWVKPPQGVCLLIQQDLTKRDKRICKDTVITWDIFDLDSAGRLHIQVGVDSDPELTYLSWSSPYRVANYVPLGEMENQVNFNVPIHRCEAVDDGTQRKITLHTMDNRSWYILLPEYDTPVFSESEVPNLNVKSSVQNVTAAGAANQSRAAPADDSPRKPAKSVLGMLLSGEYKNVKKEGFHFHGNQRNSYEMSSSRFQESAVPQGMLGKCRYQFKGAPGDPSSGSIECYDTDGFDTIYTHVTCFSQLKPRHDPAAKAKPASKP